MNLVSGGTVPRMTTARPDPQRVLREYLRVSMVKDTGGRERERSPNQQHGDHQKDAERQGFELHPNPYRDVGSASRYATKARDDFDRMIADLQAGRFDADGLALWEGSRGSRKMSEWALLLDLLAEGRKAVWIHTHGRMYDTTNHRDRRTLLEEAVDAEYESGKTSDRLIRDHADRAAEGRPAGRVSFGYQAAYDERTGKLLGRIPDPKAAPLVVELFDRFTSGVSLRSIAKDWEVRGVVNGSDNPYTVAHLRTVLQNRAYIGERVHMPGRRSRWFLEPEHATITPGTWEPIVAREVFFLAQAILTDPSRRAVRYGEQHMLSGVALCDPCSGRLYAMRSNGNRTYRCRDKGCVQVSEDELDAVAERRILAYLTSPKVYEGLEQAHEAAHVELAEVDAQLAQVRHELQDLEARVSSGRLSLDFAEKVEPGMRSRIAELQERRDGLATPSALRGLIQPGEDAAQRWAAVDDIGRRRGIAALVLTPAMAGQLRVARSPIRHRRVPAENRVVFMRD
jgi:site-specific DNA recombinase